MCVSSPPTERCAPHEPHAASGPPCTTQYRYGLRPSSPLRARQRSARGASSVCRPRTSDHTAYGTQKNTRAYRTGARTGRAERATALEADEEEEEERADRVVEREHLRLHGVQPHQWREGEGAARQQPGPGAAGPEPDRAAEQAGCRSVGHGRHEIDPPRRFAPGQPGERVREERPRRVAWWVCDAELNSHLHHLAGIATRH
eukprot:scaffold17799_cov65-Phaeocystis_antarctica.AAC.3